MPLLVLDEPTSGLDPLMEEVFQSELAALRDDGRTVLLSSHILSEVENACDRVSIVRAGRIVDTGSLADLRHLTRTRVHAVLAAAHPRRGQVWPGIHDVPVDGAELRCSVDADHLGELVAALGRPGHREPHLPAPHPRGALPRPLPGTVGMTAATAPTGDIAPACPRAEPAVDASGGPFTCSASPGGATASSFRAASSGWSSWPSGRPRPPSRSTPPTRQPRPGWPGC